MKGIRVYFAAFTMAAGLFAGALHLASAAKPEPGKDARRPGEVRVVLPEKAEKTAKQSNRKNWAPLGCINDDQCLVGYSCQAGRCVPAR